MLSACAAAVKCRSVPHHCVVIFFFVVHRKHGMYAVYIQHVWKLSSVQTLGGISGMATFINIDEHLQ